MLLLRYLIAAALAVCSFFPAIADNAYEEVQTVEFTPAGSDYFGSLEVEDTTVKISAEAYQDALGTGLATILMQAASEVVYDDYGETVGYRLLDIDKGSIFDLVGIENGDTVTHIYGIQIDSPLTAIQVLRIARNLTNITYTVVKPYGLVRTYQVMVQ